MYEGEMMKHSKMIVLRRLFLVGFTHLFIYLVMCFGVYNKFRGGYPEQSRGLKLAFGMLYAIYVERFDLLKNWGIFIWALSILLCHFLYLQYA